MIHWLPRTLMGQMLGILLIGLFLAQILNRAIHLYQHHQLAEKATQIQAARRVSGVIQLLSALSPENKHIALQQFYDPHMQIRLLPVSLRASRTGNVSDPRFKVFRLALYGLLGEKQPLRLILSEPKPQQLMLEAELQDNSVLEVRVNLLHEFEEDSALALHLTIVLFAIIGFSFVAVHWVTRPLQELASAAEELGKDIHRSPLDERGSIEVSRAARAFNSMQASLISHIQHRTQLLAAISHDLKTPITRLRLRTELLEDTVLRERFQKDLDEMESMVMATLDFMRGVDQQEAMQPVDMLALVESLQADAQEMHASVTIKGAIAEPYVGKPTALKRCISNLLDNALKYGQAACIELHDSVAYCTIRIVDEGQGIADEQLTQVFAPYYRLESSRNRDSGGTGLGLSIAMEIAKAHGGDIVLENTTGGGLAAVLTLSRTLS